MKHAFFSGICAGIMVGIGGAIYLACAGAEQKPLGAILFSVALLSICMLGYFLYTGKIGFLAEGFTADKVKCLAVGLAGNYIGATGLGLLMSFVIPAMNKTAEGLCVNKLTMPWWGAKAIALGAFCGILMYVAVKIWLVKGTALGVLFCIPTFILAGFEHSVADMFYIATARNFSWEAFAFLALVVLGNSIGAVILPLFMKLAVGKKTEQ